MTNEVHHLFFLRFLNFGSLRHLPKTDLDQKIKPLPDKSTKNGLDGYFKVVGAVVSIGYFAFFCFWRFICRLVNKTLGTHRESRKQNGAFSDDFGFMEPGHSESKTDKNCYISIVSSPPACASRSTLAPLPNFSLTKSLASKPAPGRV